MENSTQQTDELNNGNEAADAAGQAQASQEAAADRTKEHDETAKLKSELAESKDKFLRLYSEFENFRRRTAREKLEMVQSANEQVIRAMLPVEDDFDRAAKSAGNDSVSEGYNLIRNKFKKTLETFGVKEMDVQQGSEFNPDFHEAITQIPAPEEKLKGKVVDVVEKGYLLYDKVIRYAKVVVGN